MAKMQIPMMSRKAMPIIYITSKQVLELDVKLFAMLKKRKKV